jgi:hypothetical protein
MRKVVQYSTVSETSTFLVPAMFKTGHDEPVIYDHPCLGNIMDRQSLQDCNNDRRGAPHATIPPVVMQRCCRNPPGTICASGWLSIPRFPLAGQYQTNAPNALIMRTRRAIIFAPVQDRFGFIDIVNPNACGACFGTSKTTMHPS